MNYKEFLENYKSKNNIIAKFNAFLNFANKFNLRHDDFKIIRLFWCYKDAEGIFFTVCFNTLGNKLSGWGANGERQIKTFYSENYKLNGVNLHTLEEYVEKKYWKCYNLFSIYDLFLIGMSENNEIYKEIKQFYDKMGDTYNNKYIW